MRCGECPIDGLLRVGPEYEVVGHAFVQPAAQRRRLEVVRDAAQQLVSEPVLVAALVRGHEDPTGRERVQLTVDLLRGKVQRRVEHRAVQLPADCRGGSGNRDAGGRRQEASDQWLVERIGHRLAGAVCLRSTTFPAAYELLEIERDAVAPFRDDLSLAGGKPLRL